MKAWKIVDFKDGIVKTLFHGNNRSRVIPLNQWITCEEKMVRNGTSKWYLSGWHIFLDLDMCRKYIPKFKEQKYIIECLVRETRKKEHSRGEVYLAKRIYLIGEGIFARKNENRNKRSV